MLWILGTFYFFKPVHRDKLSKGTNSSSTQWSCDFSRSWWWTKYLDDEFSEMAWGQSTSLCFLTFLCRNIVRVFPQACIFAFVYDASALRFVFLMVIKQHGYKAVASSYVLVGFYCRHKITSYPPLPAC